MGIIFTWLMFLLPNIWSTAFVNPFTYPKWIIFHLMVFVAAVTLIFKKNILLPRNTIVTFVLILLTMRMLQYSSDDVTLDSIRMFLSMMVLTLFFGQYSLEKLRPGIPFIVGGLALTLQCFTITSPVGNLNILAEFVVMAIAIGLFLVNRKAVGDVERWVLRGTIFGLSLVVLMAQSRSAWLGAILLLIYQYRRFKKTIVAIVVSCLLMFVGYSALIKKGSTGHRFDLYVSSMSMLLDNPMGVGGGQFEFNFIPYQMQNAEYPREVEIYQTPHNEFLKWGIEQGWMSLIVIVGLFATLFYQAFAMQKTGFYLFAGGLLAILPQLLFQFPFENPATLVIMAFLFSRIPGRQDQESGALSRTVFTIYALLMGIYAVQKIAPKYLESFHKEKPEQLQQACKLDPSNWRVCFTATHQIVMSEKAPEALGWLQMNLKNRPFDFHALRSLAFYYGAIGEQKKACEVAKVYDLILKDSIMLDLFIKDKCKKVPVPIEYKNPKQFEKDYKAWLGL